MQNFIGQQVDRYRITESLGMGGMAVVYKAYDVRLEREVAFKVIRTEAIPPEQMERLMKRFEREAKSQAGFSHPNIVPVYDYGEINGSPYIVMEYISGGTLKDKLEKPIPYLKAIRWVMPIADALSYAHGLGVVHRDVKPSNILFDYAGTRPMLTDFGIAKILEKTDATLTGTGLGVGTPEYMAPEQWQGEALEACDQYALGVVLYEMVTGQKPYTAVTPLAVALKQFNEPLPRPSDLVDGLPEEVEKVLYKALARHPHDRYESMSAFNKAMQNFIQGIDTVDLKAGSSQEKKEKDRIPPAVLSGVDSEGETVDVMDATPAKSVEKSQTEVKSKNRLPVWALWGGLGLLIVCLLGIVATYVIFGTDILKRGVNPSPTQQQAVSEQKEAPQEQNNPIRQPTQMPTWTAVVIQPTDNVIVSPTKTQSPTRTPSKYITPVPNEYFPISGCASSHLHVGDSAFVSYDGGKNHVRSEPDTAPSDNIIFDIQPGEVVQIIGGPKCNYGWVLWEILTTRQETGWTPESNGDEFWLLPVTTRQICEDALPSRLVVGKKAKVNEEPPDANLLRTGPGRFYEVIDRVKPGHWMMVLEGPECGEAANWWKVENLDTGKIGWTMEGSLDIYYLSPEP